MASAHKYVGVVLRTDNAKLLRNKRNRLSLADRVEIRKIICHKNFNRIFELQKWNLPRHNRKERNC